MCKNKTLKYLDYGCGNGLMLKILNSKGYNFEGYDPFSEYFKN
ncbi:methyltransferase domain-containing protein [Campylobacter sp. W0066.2]